MSKTFLADLTACELGEYDCIRLIGGSGQSFPKGISLNRMLQ